MLLNESQYSNSVQKYGKNLVDAVLQREPYLSQRFLMKMCQFTYEEKIPFEKIHLIFSKIQEYRLNIPNINILSYNKLESLVNQCSQDNKTLFENPYYQSEDGMLEIYLIHNYGEVKRLPFRNSWCIKDVGNYNYHAFDKSTTMYLIYNKQYSKRSNMRYVMAEVYPKNTEEDERIIYWATNNDIINGAILTNYIQSLGSAVSKIQLIPLEETFKRSMRKNPSIRQKNIIRISEAHLYQIIEEAIINELKTI